MKEFTIHISAMVPVEGTVTVSAETLIITNPGNHVLFKTTPRTSKLPQNLPIIAKITCVWPSGAARFRSWLRREERGEGWA